MSRNKATVLFTPKAWTKMWLLVDMFDSEVAWAAICERGKQERTYLVSDIIVHDQVVTGGTVRTDPAEYDEWLDWYRMNDEETFFKICLHAHSHYTMAAFPSGLDMSLQEDIIEQLDGDMFYIFMIVNRRRDMWIRIADSKDQCEYRVGDVYWAVIDDDGFHSSSFLRDAQDKVTQKKYRFKVTTEMDVDNGEDEEDEDGFGEEL